MIDDKQFEKNLERELARIPTAAVKAVWVNSDQLFSETSRWKFIKLGRFPKADMDGNRYSRYTYAQFCADPSGWPERFGPTPIESS